MKALGKEENAMRKEQMQRQVDATLKCAERLQQFAPQVADAPAPAPAPASASAAHASKLPMDLSYSEALARGRELDKCGKFGLAVQYYEDGVRKLLQKLQSGTDMSEADRRAARKAAAQYLTRIELLMKASSSLPLQEGLVSIPVAVAHEIPFDDAK